MSLRGRSLPEAILSLKDISHQGEIASVLSSLAMTELQELEFLHHHPRFLAGTDIQLAVNALDVRFDRVDRDHQFAGDIAVRQPCRQQLEPTELLPPDGL